eukprot:TRINITY_DN2288_c0_g1_i4.p1 TRINITY_DN2288_c0_g1~~TRINITY_DN2288_c0_g1_i4.p1  ORF type:complete len:317 (-),score=86.32 TRINITY_DN2288_c0_g1_i4:288-1238(-)
MSSRQRVRDAQKAGKGMLKVIESLMDPKTRKQDPLFRAASSAVTNVTRKSSAPSSYHITRRLREEPNDPTRDFAIPTATMTNNVQQSSQTEIGSMANEMENVEEGMGAETKTTRGLSSADNNPTQGIVHRSTTITETPQTQQTQQTQQAQTEEIAPMTEATTTELPQMQKKKRAKGKSVRVPSSQLERVWEFGGLAAGLATGTISEMVKRTLGGRRNKKDEESGMGGDQEINKAPSLQDYHPFFNEQNATRLVMSLCKMRGAALKLGQMLSKNWKRGSGKRASGCNADNMIQQGTMGVMYRRVIYVLQLFLILTWN